MHASLLQMKGHLILRCRSLLADAQLSFLDHVLTIGVWLPWKSSAFRAASTAYIGSLGRLYDAFSIFQAVIMQQFQYARCAASMPTPAPVCHSDFSGKCVAHNAAVDATCVDVPQAALPPK